VLACGLANTIGALIAARAVQGVGAAIVSPAVLSIIMTTFHEGAERVFQAYHAILDEAAAALDRAGQFLSAHLADVELSITP
jgi:MFS family permease